MYYNISDFKNDWAYESQATMKVLNNITDESLNQKVYDDGRTLGILAWHLVTSLQSMPAHAGILPQTAPNTDVPKNAKTIVAEYNKASEVLINALAEKWTDESLKDEIQMYGQTWKKGNVLTSIILHQTHHRGQITVFMRQAGLKVPGVYGPSREEWVSMNMKSPQ